MRRKIVVTSGKGGVGKTTIVANLGGFLAKRGFRVAMIDADFGLNNLDIIMGVENRVIYDIVDVIEGRSSIRQALIKCGENLFVMPSCHGYDKSRITGQNLKVVVERLSDSFDYVLIDCPAGIELGFHRAVAAASEALVVTTPGISSVRDGSKVIKMLKSYEMPVTGVVVNMARGDLMVTKEMMDAYEISELLETPAVGVIPDDDMVGIHASIGMAISEGNSAYDAFEVLADNVNLKQNILYDCTKKFKGFFGKIKRDLKRRV